MTRTELRKIEDQLQTAVLPVRYIKGAEDLFRTYDGILFAIIEIGEAIYLDFAEIDACVHLDSAAEVIAMLRK